MEHSFFFVGWCFLGPFRDRVELAVLLLNLVVILVVVVMSVAGCDLLQDAFRGYGAERYGIGNFLVHYLPSVVVVWFGEHDVRMIRPRRQGILAAGLLSFYLARDDFTTVYGCTVPEQAAELFTVLVLLLAWLPDELQYFVVYPEPLTAISSLL